MVAVVAAVGCGQDPVLVCEDASIPAVTVVVRDSVTNAPIPQGLEMVGILRDGAFTEPMGRAGSPALAGKTVRLSAESRAVGIAMTYSQANVFERCQQPSKWRCPTGSSTVRDADRPAPAAPLRHLRGLDPELDELRLIGAGFRELATCRRRARCAESCLP